MLPLAGSPWWLVRKGRMEDAKRSLRRLTTREKSGEEIFSIDEQVAMMVETHRLETEVSLMWEPTRTS